MDRERHHLVAELDLDETVPLDLIAGAGRLEMAVRGRVAEVHLQAMLRQVEGVSECHRINEEGQPDIRCDGWSPDPAVRLDAAARAFP